MITHKSVLGRFLSIGHNLASLHLVLISLFKPLNLGVSKMWVITNWERVDILAAMWYLETETKGEEPPAGM